MMYRKNSITLRPIPQERKKQAISFLPKNTSKKAKTGSTSCRISPVGRASLSYFCEKWGLNFFGSKEEG